MPDFFVIVKFLLDEQTDMRFESVNSTRNIKPYQICLQQRTYTHIQKKHVSRKRDVPDVVGVDGFECRIVSFDTVRHHRRGSAVRTAGARLAEEVTAH